jgi:hypothetical protein
MSNFITKNKYIERVPATRLNKENQIAETKTVTFLHCQTKEDKIIRNLWFVFVLSVFAFLSVLWYFRGEFFGGDLLPHHELFMAHF